MRARPRACASLCLVVAFCLVGVWYGPLSVAAATPVVRALAVTPDLGSGAHLMRLAAAPDDLYVVDAAPEHVRRYILHGLPYAELFTQVMRWKEGANGLIMGRPLDLALNGQRLFILDDLGSLWSYRGSDYVRTLVPLRLQSNQGTPMALAFHGADLLLLDPGRREVWVYAPDAAGGYDTAPRALTPRPLPALAGATRLAVSRDALLVLRADGRIVALPWSHPGASSIVRAPFRVTALWCNATGNRLLVSSTTQVAVLAPGGAALWRATLSGVGGEAIADIARSADGTLYAITATRILRVAATAPL